MKRIAAREYLVRAASLTREQAERVFARMPGKLERRVRNRRLDPIEAVAIQFELEDEQLDEWRLKWAEISAR